MSSNSKTECSGRRKHEHKERVLCGTCRSKDKYYDGVSYCMKCKDHLCQECTRNHKEVCTDTTDTSETEQSTGTSGNACKSDKRSMHNPPRRFSAHRGILRRGTSAKQHGMFSARCTKHPEYELDSFCQEHDIVVCSECMSGRHRECFVISVEEASRGMCESSSVKVLIKEFKRLQDTCQIRIAQLQSAADYMRENVEANAKLASKKGGNREDTGLEERNEKILRQIEEIVSVERKLGICQEIDTCIALVLKALENSVISGNEINCFVTFHTNRKYVQTYKEKLDQVNADENEKNETKNNRNIEFFTLDGTTGKSTHQLFKTEINKLENNDETTVNFIKKDSCEQSSTGRIRENGHENSDNSTQQDEMIQKSVLMTNQADKYKNRTSTSESKREVLTNVRVMSSEKARRSAKSRSSQGSITSHFHQSERLLCESDQSDSNSISKESNPTRKYKRHRESNSTKEADKRVAVQCKVTEKQSSEGAGQESNNASKRDSSTKGTLKERVEISRSRGDAIVISDAKNAITAETNGFDDVELSSAYGAEELQQLMDDDQSLSEFGDSEYEYPSGRTSYKHKSSGLIFYDTQYIRIQSPGRTLLSGKRLTWTERTSTKQSKPYVSRPDTRLVVYQQIHTRTSADSKRVEISAIESMPDGRIIVCDASNMKVKLFEIIGDFNSSLAMRYAPFAVTSLSNALVAVLSGLALEQLFILHVSGEIFIRKVFKTNVLCRDVASFESNIYLLCVHNYETEILIMRVDGVVNTRIGIGIFSPQCIAANPGSGVIYVTDERDGVSAIEVTGTRFVLCKDKGTERYHGLACDLNGHVFVTTESPTGVHEMTRDGQYIVPLLLWKGRNYVRSVCYNRARNDIILGFNSGEALSVVKVIDGTLF